MIFALWTELVDVQRRRPEGVWCRMRLSGRGEYSEVIQGRLRSFAVVVFDIVQAEFASWQARQDISYSCNLLNLVLDILKGDNYTVYRTCVL
jgi:hypothetical protein